MYLSNFALDLEIRLMNKCALIEILHFIFFHPLALCQIFDTAGASYRKCNFCLGSLILGNVDIYCLGDMLTLSMHSYYRLFGVPERMMLPRV